MTLRTTPRLELRLVGEMQAVLDGTPLTGKLYGKVLALLAYLAVESNRRHSRETLADLLWPTLPADAARTNLRQALYYLRRAFGDVDFLLASRATVGFSTESPCWLDVKAFLEPAPHCSECSAGQALAPCVACLDAMAKRMSLYRDEFLAGLTLDVAPEFEEGRAAKRELLHREALGLLERLRFGCERRGAPEQALLYARRYTELEPWDEEGHRQFMRLLAENSQRAAALAQFENCREMLARELGLEPEASTVALAERIREGALDAAPAHTPAPLASASERRQATILCCRFDIRDQDDPDEIAERLREPRRRCAELVRRHGGHIAQTHGGTILAYFGYPVAFEDAAVRTVRAALALAEEMGAQVPVLIGIHTGIIVTGENPILPDIAGVASNVALRLCDSAAAGEVLISAATGRLVDGFFRLQPVEQPPSKGLPPPGRRAYRVTGETGATSRLEAAPRLLPLIGRRAELARLWSLWKAAKQGRGHLLLVRGEAGIGKSRLIRALRDAVSKEPCIVRELHCFPEYAQTPLHPVIALLETVFRLEPNDAPATRFDKIVAYLAEHFPKAAGEIIPVISTLVGAAGDDKMPDLPPQQQKEYTFSVLLNLMEGLAAKQPLLLIVEDVHWIDPSTRELLERHAQRELSASVLVVYSARPEFQPAGFDKQSILELTPLNDADVARLVTSVGTPLAVDTVRRIVARADGVPLFAEEMALMANEQTLGDTGIPATLHYLLLARLDAQKEARRVAQLAATLGREFDRELLAHLDGREPAALDAALQALQEAGLISATTASGTGFQFHHALIQEAAYLSQTKIDRQAAHRCIAEALSTRFPQRAAQRPEQVARHFTAANAPAEALPWWLAAGRRALRACANAEAVDHLRAGLALIERLPIGNERDAMELELLLPLEQALLALHGDSSEEAVRVRGRAFALRQNQASSIRRFEAEREL